jgi:hypothetical protein
MIGKQGKQPLTEQTGKRVEDGFPELPRPMEEDAKPSYINRSEKVEDGHEAFDSRMKHPFRANDFPNDKVKPSFNNVPNAGYNEFSE